MWIPVCKPPQSPDQDPHSSPLLSELRKAKGAPKNQITASTAGTSSKRGSFRAATLSTYWSIQTHTATKGWSIKLIEEIDQVLVSMCVSEKREKTQRDGVTSANTWSKRQW